MREDRDRVLQMARYADGTTMTSTWVCISGVPLVRATEEWERLIVDILAGAGLKPVMASIHKASSHGRTAGMLNICEGMGDLMVQILAAEAFSVGGRRGIRDTVTSITLGRRSYILTGIREDPGKAKLRTVAILRGCPQADGAAGAAVEDVSPTRSQPVAVERGSHKGVDYQDILLHSGSSTTIHGVGSLYRHTGSGRVGAHCNGTGN